jgi:hypothetical protein
MRYYWTFFAISEVDLSGFYCHLIPVRRYFSLQEYDNPGRIINGHFSRSASSRYCNMGWWNLLLGRNPSYKHRCLISGAAAPRISTFTNRGNSPLSHTVDYAAWTYDGIWTTSTIICSIWRFTGLHYTGRPFKIAVHDFKSHMYVWSNIPK